MVRDSVTLTRAQEKTRFQDQPVARGTYSAKALAPPQKPGARPAVFFKSDIGAGRCQRFDTALEFGWTIRSLQEGSDRPA